VSIHVKIDLNGWQALDNMTLTRVTNLDFDVLPDDTVSRYRVTHWGPGLKTSEVFITHRYGDGRRRLALKALQALEGDDSQ
jgi:hypothetical protein